MPFVKNSIRKPLLDGTRLPAAPGELCFLEYKKIKDAWAASPRWTTVHDQFRAMTGCDDEDAAKFLAFLEFYFNHGHPYELDRKAENGDIEGEAQ